jgi:hypothetical protein
VLQKDIREKTVYSYQIILPKEKDIKHSDVSLDLPPGSEIKVPVEKQAQNN